MIWIARAHFPAALSYTEEHSKLEEWLSRSGFQNTKMSMYDHNDFRLHCTRLPVAMGPADIQDAICEFWDCWTHACVSRLVRAKMLLCGGRLEEISSPAGMEVLQQFDGRLSTAAQALMGDEWLADLVASGGSPPEILRLPSSQATPEACTSPLRNPHNCRERARQTTLRICQVLPQFARLDAARDACSSANLDQHHKSYC